MDIYVRNDEGIVGRHHKRCVCKIHIRKYIHTGITKELTEDFIDELSEKIAVQAEQIEVLKAALKLYL